MPDNRLRRVVVLAGTSLGWREKIMRGISRYAHDHGPWHIFMEPEGAEDSLFFSENYRWDGLIVRVISDRRSRRVLALGVPAVSIGSVKVHSRHLPRVKVDDEKLTALVARHLLAGGLRRFAYVNFFPKRTDEDRGAAFARHVGSHGYPCDFYCESSRLRPGASWQARQRDLARWLRRLEKPVGIFTWNADVACQVVEACQRAGVAVPGDAAVVSGDEDMKCELARPAISAIEIPAERIGYEAAALLDRMMNGVAAPAEQVLVEPSGALALRESSNISGREDWEVHQAVRFIREHAGEPITVDEVARQVQVSRRWLERHFRRVLGRAPHEELREARLERAKKLLLETDWALADVALATGLTSAPYLSYVFRRTVGCTPAEFRRRFRPH
jgi:LacI family transcriptional regulator